MSRIGLLGGAYTSQSVALDSQSCVNLLAERDESQAGKSEGDLVLRPGLKTFNAALPVTADDGDYRAVLNIAVAPSGRVFALVLGTNLPTGENEIAIFELAADGTPTFKVRIVMAAAIPVAPLSVAYSAQFMIFPVAGLLFSIDYSGPGLILSEVDFNDGVTQVTGVRVAYIDGYFLALQADSNQVRYSPVGLVTAWDPTAIFAVSITADRVRNVIVDHREVWLQGDVDTVVYYDSGDLLNPFQPNPSGFIQQGTGAAAALVQLDNTLLWIGKDAKGQGIAWRANGYTPQRISTFAIETAWAGYATIADAVGYPVQIQGHSLWVIYFPTANKTWVYDVASGLWGEWNHRLNDNTLEGHRSWVHAFAFGKHLVGDWKTGNIYEMAFGKSDGAGGWLFCDDFDDPIQWQRRFPYVAQENERLFHQVLEVDVETGLGPVPPLASSGDLGALTLGVHFNLPALPQGAYTVILAAYQGTTLTNLSAPTDIVLGSPNTIRVTTPFDLVDSQSWKAFYSDDGGLTWHFITAAGPYSGVVTLNDIAAPLATPPDQNFRYRGPIINLRKSDDRGHSYSDYQPRDCGQAGEYSKRVRWTRLGASRSRVYELSGSDPIPWRLIDAYLEAAPGFGKGTPRLMEKLRQQA